MAKTGAFQGGIQTKAVGSSATVSAPKKKAGSTKKKKGK